MLSQGVHHHRKCEQMAPHNEDEKNNLRRAHELTPKPPEKHVASVCHAVHMRISQFELSEGVAGIRGKDAETDDEDYGPG